MASMISRLYHDELRLSERDYPEDSRAFILLDSFKEDADWLKEMLDGKAKEGYQRGSKGADRDAQEER